MHRRESEWFDPLLIAQYINSLGIDYVFLYSSLQTNYSGRYSYLAYQKTSQYNDLGEFRAALLDKQDKQKIWFGYLGYELKNEFEILPRTAPSWIEMPILWLCSFANIIKFDHLEEKIDIFSIFPDYQLPIEQAIDCQINMVEKNQVLIDFITSNMTKDRYLQNIHMTLDAIKRGDFYQANITRKFYGNLQKDTEHINKFNIFEHLCKVSPSPYSSFLQLGKYSIISSSPEMFLKIENNIAETRPIKGTAARFEDPVLDKKSKEMLLKSEKDRSENLMIVDLMRNDFARGSLPATVSVSDLFGLYSYSTVHHLFSTVRSQKKDELSSLGFIQDCFPPGSVTGAPKIQAMKWCAHLEKIDRGVYCGGIGWLDQHNADLAVAIRTLIIADNKFEFQVGGGIVAESDPISEWRETLIKAKGMLAVLNLTDKDILF